jgi:hypothetical protein
VANFTDALSLFLKVVSHQLFAAADATVLGAQIPSAQNDPHVFDSYFDRKVARLFKSNDTEVFWSVTLYP